ncbi:MAG: hypothetical protein K6G60_06085 [Lachnospiraceae bacterium]|nr:hypothetical protein [Lachnospiraceae bacterium]
MIKKITDNIAYIPASEGPLSADIGLVMGNRRIYVFDTGNGDAAYKELKDFLDSCPEKEAVCILSHFHEDHTANFARFDYSKIYVSPHTNRYIKIGEPLTSPLTIEDGVSITVFPLPSSHAKGCLGMTAEGCAFLGDATYPAEVNNEEVYNKGLLQEELEVLKELPVKSFLLSHKPRFIYPAKVVIRELESVYGRRLPNEQYIKV